MSDSQPRLLLEELRSTLSSVTESLFHNASFVQGQFTGAGSRLASLCRGPACADKTLQHLEHRWDYLQGGGRSELAGQWENSLTRLAQRLRESRDGCQCSADGNGGKALTSCAICRPKVAEVAEDLEKFAMGFAEKLDADERAATRRDGLENIHLKEVAIRRLEDEARTLKDDIEQKASTIELLSTQNTTQRVSLEEARDARREFEMTCHMLEEELGEAIDSIEKCAENLRKAERWDMAEKGYDTVHRLLHAKIRRMETRPAHDGTRRDLEIRSLTMDYLRVLALTKLSRYPDAEHLARQVWQRRKELLVETSSEVRDVFLMYCELLTRNNRCSVAEREYMYMFYDPNLQHPTDPKDIEWNLVVMTQIGRVMFKQDKYDEAVIWHRKVVDKRIAATPIDVNKAANSAVELLRAQKKQAKGFTIVDHKMKADLDKIWRLRERNHEQLDVLSCGFHLGIRLQEEGKEEEAANVLWDVWNSRKQPAKPEETLATAKQVETLLVKLKNLPRLEILYEWLRKFDGPGNDEAGRIWFQYKLACVQAISEKLVSAESLLQEGIQRRAAMFGSDDPEFLQQTFMYGEVLKRLGKFETAKDRLRDIWDRRQHLPDTAFHVVLKIGHLYGDVLMESGAFGDLEKATIVLKDAWDKAMLNLARFSETRLISKKNQVLYGALMVVGDCYGICLMKQKKYNTAKDIFATVFERKRDLFVEQMELDKTEQLLRKARDLRGSRHPSPATSMSESHPLDLSRLLAHWSAVIEAPTLRGQERGLIEGS